MQSTANKLTLCMERELESIFANLKPFFVHIVLSVHLLRCVISEKCVPMEYSFCLRKN